jgi:DNA-binding response OmpR family regulator
LLPGIRLLGVREQREGSVDMTRILIIDDDIELCGLVREFLEQEGFSVEAVQEGARGVERALSGDIDLAVLDVMMPGMNGLEVLKRIRSESDLPVIMLTARGEEVDRIVGLEIGADDYMPKPFNPRELTARLRAVLRRSGNGGTEEAGRAQTLRIGDLQMDLGARAVQCAGNEVRLTGVEFSLLEQLVRSPGQVSGRDELSREVLKKRPSPFDRSLDVHVSNLRKKLGPMADGSERIKTVRGQGYLYVNPATETGNGQP